MTGEARAGKGPKSGPFSQVAEIIRKAGAFPIPCGGDDGKEPSVTWKHFKSLPSRKVIADWLARFGGANVGILTEPSRLTVVDVDDPELLSDAIAEHGDTPLIVGTPRGRFHLYYRSMGEATVTKKNGAPIDIRGRGGFVVAPPSARPGGGVYRFHRGSWSDLEKLPNVSPGSLPMAIAPTRIQTVNDGDMVAEGARNDTLFRELLRIATQCETCDELAFRAEGFNAALCDPPLTDPEVRATVRSVWKYRTEGRLWVGTEARAVFTRDELYALADDADALALLALLRIEHGGRNLVAFSVSPKAMASYDVLPRWSTYRYRRARDILLKTGDLRLVHEGGKSTSDPSMFILATGQKSEPNITKTSPLFRGWRVEAIGNGAELLIPADVPLFGNSLPVLPTPDETLRQQARAVFQATGRGAQSRAAERLGVTRGNLTNFLKGRQSLNPNAEAVLRTIVLGGDAA